MKFSRKGGQTEILFTILRVSDENILRSTSSRFSFYHSSKWKTCSPIRPKNDQSKNSFIAKIKSISVWFSCLCHRRTQENSIVKDETKNNAETTMKALITMYILYSLLAFSCGDVHFYRISKFIVNCQMARMDEPKLNDRKRKDKNTMWRKIRHFIVWPSANGIKHDTTTMSIFRLSFLSIHSDTSSLVSKKREEKFAQRKKTALNCAHAST